MDWNGWISLDDNPTQMTTRINKMGRTVLPGGINEIVEHLDKGIDNIPLQVPMFCDVKPKATRKMFQIYQENGDVVACIGNVLNSQNLLIF